MNIDQRWGSAGRWLIQKSRATGSWFVYAPSECLPRHQFPTFEAARAAFTAGGKP